MSMNNKFIPFYFPQFYSIPENDNWWGNGYTDWQRVRNSKPINKWHNQPRVPLNDLYYDQSKSDTILNQINLALEYDIYGFNFYHYWFDGKILLEKPIKIFKQLNHNLKYCITWANETWTKRWDGKFNEVLIKQNHFNDESEWLAHFNYLFDHFKDEKYIRIQNKPVFCIYRPDLFLDIDKFIKFFEKQAKSRGLEGIYFIAVKAYETGFNVDNFNATLRFQPRDLFRNINSKANPIRTKIEKLLRNIPEQYQIIFSEFLFKFQKNETFDYNKFSTLLIENAEKDSKLEKKVFQSVITDWDNTARYGHKAKYFINSNPENFDKLLFKLIELNKYDTEKIIFINAWNEWSEGAYLEPDIKNGFKFLEIVKKYANIDL